MRHKKARRKKHFGTGRKPEVSDVGKFFFENIKFDFNSSTSPMAFARLAAWGFEAAPGTPSTRIQRIALLGRFMDLSKVLQLISLKRTKRKQQEVAVQANFFFTSRCCEGISKPE